MAVPGQFPITMDRRSFTGAVTSAPLTNFNILNLISADEKMPSTAQELVSLALQRIKNSQRGAAAIQALKNDLSNDAFIAHMIPMVIKELNPQIPLAAIVTQLESQLGITLIKASSFSISGDALEREPPVSELTKRRKHKTQVNPVEITRRRAQLMSRLGLAKPQMALDLCQHTEDLSSTSYNHT